ncbi:uncharacterized protein LOC135210437 [Macrobrachium nipponense]|uniref:uncharacterized protein LOC135210437 n=1 Tax=Macrobrachium nipponense TaxID=159736 RepID=UPI0030C8CDF5
MSTAASPIRVRSIVNNERFSPHGRVQMKNSPSSSRRTPVSSHPPTPKRITSGIYDLTHCQEAHGSRVRVSPTKKTGSSTRLSTTKRTLPGRRCSVGRRSLLRTPSPNKRLKTPISLPSPKISSSKMQQLRRTPAIGTPSPRRRLYWDDDKDVLILEDLRPLGSPVTGLGAGSLKNESTEPDDILELEQQSQRPKIFVNMSASVTRAILEWIYTGECTETASLSRALLVGSIRHDVTGLARSCEYHLAADLTPVNAPELIFLAHKYSALKLKELALAFAVQEAAEVTAQPMWSNLAVRVPGVIAEYSRRLATRATSVAKK